MSSAVLLIFIGFLGPTCVHLNNEFQPASSTVSPHNTSSSDRVVTVKTQMINRVVQLWPAANRTEIKTFRKGSLIIARRYWYPFLEIGLKKPQPTSRAITTATTPTVPNTTQSLTSNLPPSTLQTITETTTSEPPTANTTISTQPNLIIQTSTTNEKPTSRSISAAPPINTAASITNTQQGTINPTQPDITTHSILSTDYSIQQTTTTTPLVTSMSSTRTTLATTFRESINNTTKNTTTRNKLTTASQVTAESVGMDTSVRKTTAVSSTNLPITSGAGDGFQDFKTTTTSAGTTAKRTVRPTTPVSMSNILGSTVTPGTTQMATTASPNTDAVKRTTPKVSTETVIKTGSSTNPPEEPTMTIQTTKVKTTKKQPNETTVSTSDTASSGVFTTAEATPSRSSGMTSTLAAAVSETSPTANVINRQETTAVKITAISSATTDIRTMTTGLAKHATVSEGIILVTETTEVTNESSQEKTEFATQEKPVTVAHTLGSATTIIGVTQEPATQNNFESATVNVRTMTTEQAKLATVHNDLETPELTTESSMAKSTTIISKAVTIDHTLEGPTTVIRVTQESSKQADPGTASTAHSTLKSNTAESSNAPTIAPESGTRTSTKVINKPEVITSKITSTQGSSSVINSESATVDIRTITTGTLPEDFTSETSEPATMATTLEGPTTVIRVTQLDVSTASTTHSTLKSNTAQSSNLTTRETESATSTSTAITNKTTTAEYTNSVLKSTSEGTRTTTTTGLAKSATVHKASTLVIETSQVTMEPPLDQTATVTSEPVTVAHTLSPNTVITATQTDLNSASITQTTLKELNTAKATGTSSATTVVNELETNTTKTSAQGSSSVKKSESTTVDMRTTTTNSLPEDFTLVQETSKLLTMGHTLEGPTTVIRVTKADPDIASTTNTTLKSNTAQSLNTPTRATESGTSTSTAVINETEAIRTKTTPAQYTNSGLKSTTEGTRTTTTGLAKSAIVPKASTLEIETSRVTMEPPLDQTATVTSKPATQTDLSSASTTHTTLKESNTADAPGTSSGTTVMNEQETSTTKTSPQGSSSVINSESATVDIRTTTTNTLREDLTLEAEKEVTSESSPAKTESITLVSMMPVTVAHTLEGSTTVIRVTEEPLTHADSNSASTTHSTLEESNTAKTNAPGTSTETAVINEQETSTTKMTSAQGSSSVKHYESASVDIRTMTTGQAKVATLPEATLTLVPDISQLTTESSPAKTESTTVKSKQVTVAHTLEGSTTVVRLTQEPGTQAEAGNASTTHTTLNKSNIDDSTSSTTTTTGSSTTTTFINELEITATKTTLAQDSTTVINSAIAEARTTTTTGLAKLATVPEALTLGLQTFNVTIEPSPPKTKSTTQDVDPDIASTAHSTFTEGSSTDKTNAPNTANAQVTSTTKITSAEGLVSVIKSTTEVTKTTTTGSTKLATESKSSTLVPQTSRVTMEPSPAKTQSAIVTSKPVTEAQTFKEPTSAIRVTQEHATQDDASTALSAHTSMEKSNTSSNAPNTVNAPGTSTATTAINQPEASTTKTSSPEGLVSVIKSTTEVMKTTTTGSTKLATEYKSSTLEPQTSGVTMEPPQAKTQSAIVTSKPITEAQTFEGPTSAIRVTQDDASTALSALTTMEKSNTSPNAPNTVNPPGTSNATTAINQPEASTTKTTSPEGLVSVIQSTTEVMKTTKTGSTKLATEYKSSTLEPQTSRVTMEPSPTKTQSAIVTSKPVTEAQTFEGPTSAIRVTQDDATQDDASTALSAHTIMEKSNTSSNARNTVNPPGTSNATTAIHQPEASTTKTTSPEGSSSVIKSTTGVTKTTTIGSTKLATEYKSSTLEPQTSGVTMEPPQAKTQYATVTSKPVTEAQTFEGPTSAIRVTQDDESTALSAHTSMEKSNTSSNAPNTVNPPGTSNATTPINPPEASTTKTTSTRDSSSVNKSSTEVTKTTGLAKNATESIGSTLVQTEPSPAKTQSTTQVSMMPITVAHTLEGQTTNATTTAPPVALQTVLKFASPTSQTLKTTENTTTYTRTTTLSPTIKSTNASRNASVPHTSPAPAQPHGHKTTSLKPPTSKAAMSVATELPTHQPVLNEGSIDLLFSLDETFYIVYSDRTTAEFLFLATKVVIAINKLYREEYKQFRRSRVNRFSKGSIKVDMTLVFENTSVVPSAANVETVLFNDVTIDGNRLNIINDTIKAVPPNRDALTTINQANTATVQQTTVKTNANTGYTNTSSASAWILHFSILAATAIITVFVTRAVV